VVVGDDPPEPEPGEVPDPDPPEPPLDGLVPGCPLELGAVLGATVVEGTVDVGPTGPSVVGGAAAASLLRDGADVVVLEAAARGRGVVVGASATIVGVVEAWAAGGRATSTPAKAPPIVNPTRRLTPAPTRMAARTTQRRRTSSSCCSQWPAVAATDAATAPNLLWRAWSASRRRSCAAWLRRKRCSVRVRNCSNPVVSFIFVDRASARACTRRRPSSAAHSVVGALRPRRGRVPLDWTPSIARRIDSTRGQPKSGDAAPSRTGARCNRG
jgi:hypothetical protein